MSRPHTLGCISSFLFNFDFGMPGGTSQQTMRWTIYSWRSLGNGIVSPGRRAGLGSRGRWGVLSADESNQPKMRGDILTD